MMNALTDKQEVQPFKDRLNSGTVANILNGLRKGVDVNQHGWKEAIYYGQRESSYDYT
jgi:hypothetical protein